ncbi:MAG: hypothetical protein DMG14_18690 [Acidobacteria bacterium]|nr:MAG: hypothetical protein DMG14_18690 [Acidobacteriota bacterium]
MVAVIVTPGINAPVESETVPPNVALLVCANVRIGNTRHNSVMAANTAFLFMMHSWTRLGVTPTQTSIESQRREQGRAGMRQGRRLEFGHF